MPPRGGIDPIDDPDALSAKAVGATDIGAAGPAPKSELPPGVPGQDELENTICLKTGRDKHR